MLDRVTLFTPSFPPSLLPSSFAKNNPDLCSYGARAAPVRLSRDLGSTQPNSDVIANVGCNFANEKDPRGLNNTYWSRCSVLAPLFLPLKLCCVSKRRQDDGHGGRGTTDVTRSRNHHRARAVRFPRGHAANKHKRRIRLLRVDGGGLALPSLPRVSAEWKSWANNTLAPLRTRRVLKGKYHADANQLRGR